MTERTGTIDWATTSPDSPAPLLVPDLLSDASTLAGLLEQALGEEQWLDAFLLAAGLTQLVEDRLHGDPMQLSRTASYLRGRPDIRPAREQRGRVRCPGPGSPLARARPRSGA